MSSPRLAIPSPRQERPQREAEMEGQQQQQQEIANLAYALWQQRGAPQGSPEEDWRAAEETLQASRGSRL